MTGALLAGLLAGYGIAMPVGAVATYLVTLTARASARVGAAGPLRWASALVLTTLAVRIAWTAIRDHRSGQLDPTGSGSTTAGRAYASLLGITLLNPVTVLYFSALVLGSRANGLGGAAESAVFVLAAFCASASWQLLLVAGGVALGRVLTGRTGRLATGLASGALILLLTVVLLLEG